MSEERTVTAWVARAGRVEAVLFERRGGAEGAEVLSALVDLQGRGLSGIYRTRGLGEAELSALRDAAAGGERALTELPLTEARARIGRAIMAHRIAGRALPQWVVAGESLLGELAELTESVEDVYYCPGCGVPLEPRAQIERARAAGRGSLARSCEGCRQALNPPEEAERLVARAWLRLLAGEPRRALINAARAEGLRIDPGRLDAIRGAATLRLDNPVQAAPYLRRALEESPRDQWVRVRLIEALTRVGYIASASAELARLVSHRPELNRHAYLLGEALAGARKTPTRQAAPALKRGLSSLSAVI